MVTSSIITEVFFSERTRKKLSRSKLKKICKIAEEVALQHGYGLLKLASHDYWRTIQPIRNDRGLSAKETKKFKTLLESKTHEHGFDKDFVILMIENFSLLDVNEFSDSVHDVSQEIYTIEIRLRAKNKPKSDFN